MFNVELLLIFYRFCTAASGAKSKDAAKTGGESNAKETDLEQKIKELTDEIDKLKVNREELQVKYMMSYGETWLMEGQKTRL